MALSDHQYNGKPEPARVVLGAGDREVGAGVDHRLSGGETSTPLREDADARRPLSPYAGSKKAAEAMAYSYHSVHGLDVTVLRF